MAFLRDRSIFCIPNTTLNDDQRLAISLICIATSTLGFIGAVLQLKGLWQLRHRQRRRPSAHPRIIFYLALSDLITCIGLFTLGILLKVFDAPIKDENNHDIYRAKHVVSYEVIGGFVETFALFGVLASVIWTLSFAIDMCFQMYQINCPMVVYHILSWCIPLHFVTVVQAVNFGIWPKVCEDKQGMKSRLIISYLPVVVVILANPILFLVTYRKVRQALRGFGSFTVEDRQALTVCKWKFFWIVAAFTICWLPTIISVGLSFFHSKPKLWALEALLNPLQGILNYFVYRRSFRVSSSDSAPGEGGLPRVAHNVNSNLDDCLRKKESKQTFGNSDSSGADETSNILMKSGRSVNLSKKTKNEYRARLLGE